MIPRILPSEGHSRFAGALTVIILAVGAFCFRVPQLMVRPMHTDEAVHAVKMAELLETGRYEYDPQDYHGPTLYYFTLPVLRLLGARNLAEIPNEIPLRVVPALFGSLLVLALLLFRSALGLRVITVAALLTAVSPAFVFYSRYYIQEVLLVCFTLCAIGSARKLFQAHGRGMRTAQIAWILALGASLGCMLATKETAIVIWACMGGAGILTWAWYRKTNAVAGKLSFRDLAIGSLVTVFLAVLTSAALLTNFLRNSEALVHITDSVRLYLHRAATGAIGRGSELHSHPWYYYLKLLLWHQSRGTHWSEAGIFVLGLAGCVRACRGAAPPMSRFFCVYALLLTIVYSLIPYKTPWNVLCFLHAWIVLAGIGFIWLHDLLPNRPLRQSLSLYFALVAMHLGYQAYRAAFVFPADVRNPYVYAGTSPDVYNLSERLEDLAQIYPAGCAMPIEVIAPGADYWPLPWYLRRFTHVAYRSEGDPSEDAVVVIRHADAGGAKQPGRAPAVVEYFGLRPDVMLTVETRQSLWDSFIETRR